MASELSTTPSPAHHTGPTAWHSGPGIPKSPDRGVQPGGGTAGHVWSCSHGSLLVALWAPFLSPQGRPLWGRGREMGRVFPPGGTGPKTWDVWECSIETAVTYHPTRPSECIIHSSQYVQESCNQHHVTFGTFSSSQKETLYPCLSSSDSLLSPALNSHNSASVSVDLSHPDSAFKQSAL